MMMMLMMIMKKKLQINVFPFKDWSLFIYLTARHCRLSLSKLFLTWLEWKNLSANNLKIFTILVGERERERRKIYFSTNFWICRIIYLHENVPFSYFDLFFWLMFTFIRLLFFFILMINFSISIAKSERLPIISPARLIESFFILWNSWNTNVTHQPDEYILHMIKNKTCS